MRPPWWSADAHADRRPRLVIRNRVKTALRAWFEARAFTEVEAAALQRSPGNETHLQAFETRLKTPEGGSSPLYLHTSPEFACKKLLAAGERRIFDFARVWRNGERSPLHHPEFTLLEWYRAEEPYEALMADVGELLAVAADSAGARRLSYRGRCADPHLDPERLSVAEAFERYAGFDLLATVSRDGEGGALAAAAAQMGMRIAPDDGWSDIFSKVMTGRIEPHLGHGRACILYDYPLQEAALARPKASDPRVCERFELYACGVELANAFGELTDADEQRRRQVAAMDEKARLYRERYPLDEDFLKAVGVMPEAAGAALGFDRLIMLLTHAERIEDVLWTPVPEAPQDMT